eukprot:Blabericola_migrator_1__798@NODE_119_length_13646_cov_70_025112_g107_i0_p9_GENE_NODE_119_length_13646_cov_70_025112_g107_i0NODE_119_length_13646_cov_70_025112_g107_i0_p9_ORF_typecomplete_len251_score26_20_NODE_119_length_13646_cov_70_025112_g107_i0170922
MTNITNQWHIECSLCVSHTAGLILMCDQPAGDACDACADTGHYCGDLLYSIPSPALDRWFVDDEFSSVPGTPRQAIPVSRLMATHKPKMPRPTHPHEDGVPKSHAERDESQGAAPIEENSFTWFLARVTLVIKTLIENMTRRHQSRSRSRSIEDGPLPPNEIYKSLQVHNPSTANGCINGCTIVGPGFITIPEHGEVAIFAPDKILRSLKLDVDNNQVLIIIPEQASPHFFIVDAPGFTAHASQWGAGSV